MKSIIFVLFALAALNNSTGWYLSDEPYIPADRPAEYPTYTEFHQGYDYISYDGQVDPSWPMIWVKTDQAPPSVTNWLGGA